MALQTLIGGFAIPGILPLNSVNAPGFASLLIDAADEKAASIFRAPKAGDIHKILWRTGVVTTGATVDVRLETVDTATGDPSGTLFGTNTNASQVVNNADDNTVFQTTLTADATVSKNDRLAVVIVNPSGSPGTMNIATNQSEGLIFPYVDLFTSSWAKSNVGGVIGLEYSDGSYAPVWGLTPFSTIVTTTFNNGSSPDEIALYFKLPGPARARGFWIWGNNDATLGDWDMVLYDSDGSSVLASASQDNDVQDGTTVRFQYMDFNSSVALVKDTNYRMAMKPTSATNVGLYEFTVASAAVMDAFPGGQAFHRSHRVDGGSWTQTTTQRPLMGIVLDQIGDDAGGGGGTFIHGVIGS